jgi:D-alanyl-lipoteichoic acid acyltransferase DltB (MBOAT superfamily)
MLFNSPEFIFLFLPIALVAYYLLFSANRPILNVAWLVITSMFFYSYWNIAFVPILVGSLLFNFGMGLTLSRRPRKWLLVCAIGANVVLLGWFKYAGFLVDNINWAFGAGIHVGDIVLPLAISFYTFQQIAFLVDAYDGEEAETNFLRYSCFVVFFPHVIAGPLVLYKDVRCQLSSAETFRENRLNLVLGLTIFAIGLFKKTCIADAIGPIADGVFGAAHAGIVPAFGEAWVGTLAYAVQLYFDFSGYSDMAIGAGLMFNIRLPINFWSPYRSASIIEFWNRWHITLTRFLTAYVYNPILMSLTRKRMRQGKPLLRRSAFALAPFLNLLVIPTCATMLLSGIWHGAGWQFVLWGLFHGVMLVINHAWRAFRFAYDIGPDIGRPFRPLGTALTFLGVVLALVFFRSGGVEQALIMLRSLGGFAGLSRGMSFRVSDAALVLLGLAIIFLLPNVYKWMGYFETPGIAAPGRNKDLQPSRIASWMPTHWRWAPSLVHGAIIGVLVCFALVRVFSVLPTQFLYFTF